MSRMTPLMFVIVTAALIAGCATAPETETQSPQALQQHTEELAAQLFAEQGSINRIAIGTLVPVDELRHQSHGPDRALAQQIQEGLFAAATQQGMQVTEYRTSRQLRLETNQELMLSRQVEELSNRQQIEYFLTGTYSEVNGGILVNLRLIFLRDSSVTAAATHFFPWSTMSGEGQLTEWRKNRLYRHPATGAPQ